MARTAGVVLIAVAQALFRRHHGHDEIRESATGCALEQSTVTGKCCSRSIPLQTTEAGSPGSRTSAAACLLEGIAVIAVEVEPGQNASTNSSMLGVVDNSFEPNRTFASALCVLLLDFALWPLLDAFALCLCALPLPTV